VVSAAAAACARETSDGPVAELDADTAPTKRANIIGEVGSSEAMHEKRQNG